MEDCSGTVGDGEFVIPCGKSAPLLHEREGSLDDVAVPVGVFIEDGRASALRSFSLSGCNLVALLRDDSSDSAGAEHAPIHPTAVCLVCQDRVRPGAWPADVDPGNTDVVEDLFQHRAVVALPTRDHNRQRQPVAIDGVMDLGCQTAARAADTVARRLGLSQRQIFVI